MKGGTGTSCRLARAHRHLCRSFTSVDRFCESKYSPKKMNSLDKSSKWPSYDSLPSTSSSFPFSENEQTEDEGDVSSEGEGDAGTRRPSSADEGIARRSGSYLCVPLRPDHRVLSRFDGDQPKLRPEKATSSPGAASLSASTSPTPGDVAFAQKCADLHRFICPLLELLRGLKTGRFDKGLTSFQQNVAIDRLQRILGMLQKPEMGEKYLQSLLQIEMLLNTWFPQEKMKSTNTPKPTTTPTVVPHRHQNQLHIPVKKRKLSWSAPDAADGVPAKHVCREHESRHAAAPLDAAASTRLPPSPESHAEPRGDDQKVTDKTGSVSKSPWRGGENQKPPEVCPSPSRCSPATQDCSVSSSDSITTTGSS